MRKNRSMPKCRVIPELEYADVEAASTWLCEAFGFTLRVSMGSHRAQMNVEDDGAIVLTQRTAGGKKFPAHSVMIRVEDADAHAKHAAKKGAKIVRETDGRFRRRLRMLRRRHGAGRRRRARRV